MLALVGACGPVARAPNPSNQTRGHVAVVHPAPTPCPSDAALAAAALHAWGKTSGQADAICAPLWVDARTVWLFDGWWEPGGDTPDDTIGAWVGITTTDGTVLWADGQDDLPPGLMDRSGTGPYVAVDFDGDGNDEVIYENGDDHGGYAERSITAASIRDGKLVAGNTLPLESDNSAADPDPADAHTCDATYQVIDGPDGTKHLAITGTGDAGDDCPPPGRHVYQWNGTTLVEVHEGG